MGSWVLAKVYIRLGTGLYGSVLVSCCAKTRHKLTLPEDLEVFRRLITATEDLEVFRKTY